MKRSEVNNHIGERISINGSGDLAIEPDKKPFIYDKTGEYDIRLLRLTKGGLIEFEVDGKHRYVVPPYNVDLYGVEPEPYTGPPFDPTQWAIEAHQDVHAQHGIDVEAELIEALKDTIR